MGGSGGGSFSPSDFARLSEAAESRIKDIASKSTRLLFCCEVVDRSSLESHLSRSEVITQERAVICDASDEADASVILGEVTVVVTFTNAAANTKFLDRIAEAALKRRKQAMHVKARPESRIPSKVTAYRWPIMTWAELEEVFSGG
jgi:hypothetical protein